MRGIVPVRGKPFETRLVGVFQEALAFSSLPKGFHVVKHEMLRIIAASYLLLTLKLCSDLDDACGR